MDTPETPVTPELPDGEYAIAECLGHRTLIGRCAEVERFGTKMLGIEPIFNGNLLPMIFVGGSSLYAFTPCSKETAAKRAPKSTWEIPESLRATLGPDALPAPSREFEGDYDVDETHDDEGN